MIHDYWHHTSCFFTFVDSLSFNETILTPNHFGNELMSNFNSPVSQSNLTMYISMTQNFANTSSNVLNCNYIANTLVHCTFPNVVPIMTPIQMNYTMIVVASSGNMNTTTSFIIDPITYYGMFVPFHPTHSSSNQHTHISQRISLYCQKYHSLQILNHIHRIHWQSMWTQTNWSTITIHLFVTFQEMEEISQTMQWLEIHLELNSIALHNHLNLKKLSIFVWQ